MVRTIVLESAGETATLDADAVSTVTSPNPNDRAFVPPDDFFDDADPFYDDPRIFDVARDVLQRCNEFRYLANASVDIVWKRRGGKSGGRAVFGKANKLSGLAAHYCPHTFVIWLAADHCREAEFTNHELEALIYHQLKHLGFEYDETTGETTWVLWPHDAELFVSELTRYGTWRDDLRVVSDTVAQLALEASV